MAAGFASLLLSGCLACTGFRPSPLSSSIPPPSSSFRSEALKILEGLSLEEKCGQVLLIGVGGTASPSQESLDFVRRLGPGGILLFSFNVGDEARDLGELIAGYQDAAAASSAGLALTVAIDHEGGSVFRFKRGLTRLPSAAIVGRRGAENSRLLGERAGLELKALGVNLALAPVVELGSEENFPVLGDRTYGTDARSVDAVAGAFIEGLESSGIASAVKHFPGNGGKDPHKDLARLEVSTEILERDYVARFDSALDHGAAVVLLSHVIVPSIDPDEPATLSKPLIQGLLKDGLHFDGVVLTDDLFMRAIAAKLPPARSAVAALAAGADLLMLSERRSALKVRDAIREAVESGLLPLSRLDDAVLRNIELKLRFSMAKGFDREERDRRLEALPSIVEESSRLLSRSKARP